MTKDDGLERREKTRKKMMKMMVLTLTAWSKARKRRTHPTERRDYE